ncbi:DUF6266 family protein [Halosquirtibacter xylanolyticus]|uniref:DUF6266 family protein n=1 Tax=Halosquirtibacter xylanolyticus TaxID=3374599 RepID=UPI0037489D91|nr:DUF6266 family protein [Prolixibacteraceae bacterium]
MAIIKSGELTGVLGPLVKYNVKGNEMLRTRPDRRKKLSVKQLSQVMKMKQTMKFLRGVRELVNHSYPSDSPFSNGHVLARSSILRNAFKGVYPDLTFDYSQVQLSSAKKSHVKSITAEIKEGVIDITVQINSALNRDDVSVLLIHEPGREQIRTLRYGPFPCCLGDRFQVPLKYKKDHGPVQNFWIMIFDTNKIIHYKSCYFSLSNEDHLPVTFDYSD